MCSDALIVQYMHVPVYFFIEQVHLYMYMF